MLDHPLGPYRIARRHMHMTQEQQELRQTLDELDLWMLNELADMLWNNDEGAVFPDPRATDMMRMYWHWARGGRQPPIIDEYVDDDNDVAERQSEYEDEDDNAVDVHGEIVANADVGDENVDNVDGDIDDVDNKNEPISDEDGDEDEPLHTSAIVGLEPLPLHLQTTILALLPPHKVVELRAVSKSWNFALRSRVFLRLNGRLQEPEPWLLMAKTKDSQTSQAMVKEFMAFIPSQRRFFPLPGLDSPQITASLGLNAMRVSVASLFHHGYHARANALGFSMCGGDAAGLLCCLVDGLLPHHHHCPPYGSFEEEIYPFILDSYRYSVVIFNPLTGVAYRLPPPPKLHFCLEQSSNVCFSIHALDANHYVVALFDIVYCHMECFDSRIGLWKVARALDTAECGTVGSLAKGHLLFWDTLKDWLYFYNLAQDLWGKVRLLWSDLEVPFGGRCPRERRARLLQCGGHILRVAPVAMEDQLVFAVWKLRRISQEEVSWRLLSHTPTELRQNSNVNVDAYLAYFSFVADEKAIYVTGSQGFVPLVYDLADDFWYHLPSHHGSFDHVCLSSFQPKFDAHPFPQATKCS